MKRLGRLNGKVVVQGDPNKVTKNQILYKKEDKVSLYERDGSDKDGSLQLITGGQCGEGTLSKGRKIVSEYYYFDVQKILKIMTVDDLKSFIISFGGVTEIIDGKYNEKSYIENTSFTSEHTNTILKFQTSNGVQYLIDSFLPPVSGLEFLFTQFAIRKYTFPIKIGSGASAITDTSSFTDVKNVVENYCASMRLPVSFLEVFNCQITEDEFWAEAEIIE